MNRIQYILTAKTQYDIQSPFLFELYNEVLNSRLAKEDCKRLGITSGDRYAELRYKLCDHYAAENGERRTGIGERESDSLAEKARLDVDDILCSQEVGLIGMVRLPHQDRQSEERWSSLVQMSEVTLSVDLYYVGIVFTYNKLSKQHILLRCS